MKIPRLFFFGVIAALSALFLELLLLSVMGSAQEMLYAFFTQVTPLLFAVVLLEEIFKFIFVYKSCSDLKSDHEETADPDAIVKKNFLASIYIGLGFSLVELLVVSLNLSLDRSFSQLVLPSLGIVVVHVVTSATMGYLLTISKSVNFVLIFKIFVVTISFHIFYNLLVIYSVNPLYIYLYLLFLILFILVMFFKITPKKSD